MKVEMFDNIVKQWKEYSDYIYLHVLGEPLMHPELDALLEVADQYDMQVTITTNGSLLKDRLSILLSHQSIRQINISIHNFKEQLDENKYIKDSIEAGNILSNQNIYVNYRFWNQKNGVMDEDTLNILRVFEDEFKVKFNGKKETLSKYQFIHFDEVFQWPCLDLPFVGDSGKCLGTRSQLGVLVDGSVIPCCLDAKNEVKLGNLNHENLNEILSSSKYLKMKKGFENNKVVEELCQHCTFRLRFK